MAREFSKAFYNSKVWKVTREYILKRDKYLCTECGKPAEEVHHIIHLTPRNIGDVSITLNPDNLKCLCRDCHFNEHAEDKIRGRMTNNPLVSIAFDENGNVIESPH